MVLEDHVRGMPLQDERSNQFIKTGKGFLRDVDAGSGFDEEGAVLTVGRGGPVISLVEPAGAFTVAAIADEGGLVQRSAVIAAGREIGAMGVAVVTQPAHSFADGGKGLADILFPAVLKMDTFISGLIEMVMFLEKSVFPDLFRDSGRVFPQLKGNTAQGEFLVQALFNGNTVI